MIGRATFFGGPGIGDGLGDGGALAPGEEMTV